MLNVGTCIADRRRMVTATKLNMKLKRSRFTQLLGESKARPNEGCLLRQILLVD